MQLLNILIYLSNDNIIPIYSRCSCIWLKLVKLSIKVRWCEWCFTPFFNHVWLYVAVSFHSWRNKLLLRVNQQSSVINWQLPLMGFEPQQRGVISFKARRLNHSAPSPEKSEYISNKYIQKNIGTYTMSWTLLLLY